MQKGATKKSLRLFLRSIKKGISKDCSSAIEKLNKVFARLKHPRIGGNRKLLGYFNIRMRSLSVLSSPSSFRSLQEEWWHAETFFSCLPPSFSYCLRLRVHL